MQCRVIYVFILVISVFVAAANANTQKWYEGGTLQNASAITWQSASYRNKLATCADFVAAMWQKLILLMIFVHLPKA